MAAEKLLKPPPKPKQIDSLKTSKAAGVLARVARARVDRHEEISNRKGKLGKTTGLNADIDNFVGGPPDK